MGNTPSRKAGSASTPQSPVNSPTQHHQFQNFPGSPTAVPVRVPTGKPPHRSGRRSESLQSPVQPPAGPATVPISVSRPSGNYAPSAPVPLPGSSRRPTAGSYDPRPAETARTMPIGVPGRGSAPYNIPMHSQQKHPHHQQPQHHPYQPPGYSHSHHPADAYQSHHENVLGLHTRVDSEDVLPSYRNEYRPPRLPLPIEDEGASLADTNISHPMPGIEPGASIVHAELSADHLDLLSPAAIETSSEEEDAADERPRQEGLVPTLIEWAFGGNKVYVTGTFANWNRKYRLHKNGPSKRPNTMSTILNLKPGTHHLKFIVDNNLHLSSEIPTTVDFTNILVNYIDVDGPNESGAADSGEGGEDEFRPGAANLARLEAQQGMKGKDQTWLGIRVPLPPALVGQVSEPLNVLPPGTVIRPDPPENATQPTRLRTNYETEYHSKIPRFLLDMEEDTATVRAARSAEVISRLYIPPTLPMFLAKSILNTATPLKDDASVLVVPNHTVLNHLATSSIKQNVLATSVTTRYRRKFLTTIMHKPVGE